MLNWIEVGALSWPFQQSDGIFIHPLGRQPSCMLGIVVLLEDEVRRHAQLVSGLEQVVVQNFTVEFGVHAIVDEFQSADAIVRHAAPNHHIAATEFDRPSHATELERFSLPAPHFGWSIGRNEIELRLVRP